MKSTIEQKLEIAKKAATSAGNKILNLKKCEIKTKSKFDIITKADLASEEIIIDTIKNKFPKDSIYSEEKGNIKGDPNSLWIIDPLDGTINFSKGLKEYAIAISYEEKNNTKIGLIYQPETKNFWATYANKPTRFNGTKIKVSQEKKNNKNACCWRKYVKKIL